MNEIFKDILKDIKLPGEDALTSNDLSVLQQFCEEKAKTGELVIEWEGGGDSGAYTLKHNNIEIEIYGKEGTDIATMLVDMVADRLDYYGFDGNFYTTGRLVYDKEEKHFYGEDNYSTSENDTQPCNIPVHVPQDVWFDSIHIFMEGGGYDDFKVQADLIVNNGPFTERHEAVAKMISDDIKKALEAVFETVESFDNVWENVTLAKNSFVANGDLLVAEITGVSYSYENNITKEVCIPVTD